MEGQKGLKSGWNKFKSTLLINKIRLISYL